MDMCGCICYIGNTINNTFHYRVLLVPLSTWRLCSTHTVTLTVKNAMVATVMDFLASVIISLHFALDMLAAPSASIQ